MKYDRGTEIIVTYPWGHMLAARALCPDGKVRKTSWMAITADTYFSHPASVKVKGRTVSGYISVDSSFLFDGDEVVLFTPHRYGKNADALPDNWDACMAPSPCAICGAEEPDQRELYLSGGLCRACNISTAEAGAR